MEPDLLGEVVQAQEEASVGEVPVEAEWEVAVPEPDLAEIAFAPAAGQKFLIKRELRAIT